jgi:mRNA-degrading endonuclease RelE of RelBE toxin-antitoxin system
MPREGRTFSEASARTDRRALDLKRVYSLVRDGHCAARRDDHQMNGGKKARARSLAYEIHFGSPKIRAAADDPMLRKTVESLAVQPRPPMAMRVGEEGPCEMWRLRIDDARVLYEIDERLRTVTIIGINHRREPYSI